MFTGIIMHTGEIAGVEDKGGIRRVLIAAPFDVEALETGASVACDGCCLTVTGREKGGFIAEVSNETLSKTTLGGWKKGANVNLERSLRLGDEMGGHIVTGHIDGTAVLEELKPDGEAYRLTFSVPEPLAPYIAPKGSIALNGISLTVNEVEGNRFDVCIIPHTWKVTNISSLKPGNKVNLEVDMLARYVARMTGFMKQEGESDEQG